MRDDLAAEVRQKRQNDASNAHAKQLPPDAGDLDRIANKAVRVALRRFDPWLRSGGSNPPRSPRKRVSAPLQPEGLNMTSRRTERSNYKIGLAEPTTLVPSGFVISNHHITSAGSGSGAFAWMS